MNFDTKIMYFQFFEIILVPISILIGHFFLSAASNSAWLVKVRYLNTTSGIENGRHIKHAALKMEDT